MSTTSNSDWIIPRTPLGQAAWLENYRPRGELEPVRIVRRGSHRGTFRIATADGAGEKFDVPASRLQPRQPEPGLESVQ